MISLIVLVHNVKSRSKEILGMTETFLRTLLETTPNDDYELILVDNGSRDDRAAWVFLETWRTRFNRAILLGSLENYPVSKWWNKAIQQANGDIIVLLNNDMIFNRQGWLQKLIKPLHNRHIGATGGHMMQWNNMSFLEGSILAFRKDTATLLAEKETTYPHIFDEQFFFTGEEVDFAQRVQRSGKTLVHVDVQDSGMVTHLSHGTLSWSNEEGGWNGQSILEVMHESRRKLCRKYGLPERVND